MTFTRLFAIVLAACAVVALPVALLLAGEGQAWRLVTWSAGGVLLTLAAHLAVATGDRLLFCYGAVAAFAAWAATSLISEPLAVLALAPLAGLPAALLLAGAGLLPGRWRVAGLSLVVGQAMLLLLPPDVSWLGVRPGTVHLAALGVALAVGLGLLLPLQRSALAEGLEAERADPRLAAVLGVPKRAGRALVLLASGVIASLAGGVVALEAMLQEPGLARPDWGLLSLVVPACVLIGGNSLAVACFTLLPVLVLPRLLAEAVPNLPDLSLLVAALGLGLGALLRLEANFAPRAAAIEASDEAVPA